MNELPKPTCGDCKAFYKEAKDEYGTIRGLCMIRKELGEIPAGLEYCTSFRVRDSRAPYVMPVNPTAQKSTSRRRETTPSAPTLHRATLENPIIGETEGEITMDRDGLKQVLRELLEEETMYGYPEMGTKWQGGSLLLKPESESNQPKEIPIEGFFHKIVMVRDRLRVLEAKINSNKQLEEQDKVELQGYISKCYGTLTTFNALFKNKGDHFSSK